MAKFDTFLGLRPHAPHPGAIQGKEGIKFYHLATMDPGKMSADCQMQPLDLSCGPRGCTPPPPAAAQTAVVEPAEPPRLLSGSPRTSEVAESGPLNLTSSSPDDTPVAASSSGPARKRFLTKYLHKDRGERVGP